MFKKVKQFTVISLSCFVLLSGMTVLQNESQAHSNSENPLKVSVGEGHSLLMRENGTVLGWGWNAYGQVGNNSNNNQYVMTYTVNIEDAVDIDAGSRFSMAVKEDGSLVAWGKNDYGIIGEEIGKNFITPTKIEGIVNVIRVAAGVQHALTLTNDGNVFLLGNGSVKPQEVKNLNQVKEIAVGDKHNLVLKLDGTVWSWGNNQYGQIGNHSKTKSETPVNIKLQNIIQISAKGNSSYALRKDGTVWAWGAINGKNYPIVIKNLSNVIQISGNLFLKNDGTVWMYYNNKSTRIVGLEKIVSISKGVFHNLAINTSGKVYSWGYNTYGQFGNSEVSSLWSGPQLVQGPIHINIKGQLRKFSTSHFYHNGTLMVSRFIFQSMGATVRFDTAPEPDKILLINGDKRVELSLGNKFALVNGKEVVINQPPIDKHGAVVIPLRDISNLLGFPFTWDQTTKTAFLK
jgi:alpha-tubulin suppressor-like RCC1 family protein